MIPNSGVSSRLILPDESHVGNAVISCYRSAVMPSDVLSDMELGCSSLFYSQLRYRCPVFYMPFGGNEGHVLQRDGTDCQKPYYCPVHEVPAVRCVVGPWV